ncbi:MAG: hypothetical protein KIH01_08450 [Candidatus Freyarchaeota archaeon]|nr:hypothetical protein [Candidatus Jordarchaeia archaeon]
MGVPLIPAGVVIIGWSKKLGAVAEAFFPESLRLSPDFVTQVFSAHFRENLNNFTPMIMLQVAGRKVVSYLTDNGEEKRCFALILHKEEKTSEWFEPLKRLASEITEKDDVKKVSSLYKKFILEKGKRWPKR